MAIKAAPSFLLVSPLKVHLHLEQPFTTIHPRITSMAPPTQHLIWIVTRTVIKFDITQSRSPILESLNIDNIDHGTIMPGEISRIVSIVQVTENAENAVCTASNEMFSRESTHDVLDKHAFTRNGSRAWIAVKRDGSERIECVVTLKLTERVEPTF